MVLGRGPRAWADEAAAPLASGAPRHLAMHNLHTGEVLEGCYWEKGAYVPDTLAAVKRLLRDHRNGEEHPIDLKLLDLMSTVKGKVETKYPFEIICGYRSPVTNAAMHKKSSQVAAKSLHMTGMAVDVRIQGVQLTNLHNAAMTLRGGGVGLYPKSNFVHLDVGSVRHWQGT